jgi:hypothetical protein
VGRKEEVAVAAGLGRRRGGVLACWGGLSGFYRGALGGSAGAEVAYGRRRSLGHVFEDTWASVARKGSSEEASRRG